MTAFQAIARHDLTLKANLIKDELNRLEDDYRFFYKSWLKYDADNDLASFYFNKTHEVAAQIDKVVSISRIFGIVCTHKDGEDWQAVAA